MGCNLKYASKDLQNDKEVVIKAVKQNGIALRYASKNLKNNKEVAIEAVKQNGDSLQLASEDLRNDKEVVIEAIKQNAYSFKCASKNLKNDKSIINVALMQNLDISKYINVNIMRNFNCIVLVLNNKFKYFRNNLITLFLCYNRLIKDESNSIPFPATCLKKVIKNFTLIEIIEGNYLKKKRKNVTPSNSGKRQKIKK